MSTKTAVTLGIIVGSSIGGLVPALWGDSLLSYGSVLWSGIGGIVGAFAGIYLGRWTSGG